MATQHNTFIYTQLLSRVSVKILKRDIDMIIPSARRPSVCLPHCRIITASPSKSSSLDRIPTFLLKEVLEQLLPFITALVNVSLSQGRLPALQKQAPVTSVLKKAGMDVADMANYRPVSDLSFLSKTTERIVVEQLNKYLTANCLLPRFQSAYRRFHSTETAVLRVMSDRSVRS